METAATRDARDGRAAGTRRLDSQARRAAARSYVRVSAGTATDARSFRVRAARGLAEVAG